MREQLERRPRPGGRRSCRRRWPPRPPGLPRRAARRRSGRADPPGCHGDLRFRVTCRQAPAPAWSRSSVTSVIRCLVGLGRQTFTIPRESVVEGVSGVDMSLDGASRDCRRTESTGTCGWLALSPGMDWGKVLRQEAGQHVKQAMPGAEIGRGGPDGPAGDELHGGGRGGPAVDVQSHAQERAQRSRGLGGPGSGVAPSRDRARSAPGRLAFAEPESGAWPVRCQLSSAARHVSSGTFTIRRNDSHPGTGPVFAVMLA